MVLELAVLFFLLFVSVTCIPIGELQEDSRTVELEGARFVEARFYFGAGQIEIFGGTKNLLEGVFEYNIERWRPEIDHGQTEWKSRKTGKFRCVPRFSLQCDHQKPAVVVTRKSIPL